MPRSRRCVKRPVAVGTSPVGEPPVSGRDAPPLAQKLLSLALLTLLACWALNEAAHLLLAVWPVLVAAGSLSSSALSSGAPGCNAARAGSPSGVIPKRLYPDFCFHLTSCQSVPVGVVVLSRAIAKCLLGNA